MSPTSLESASIIVAARDEERLLPALLQRLRELDWVAAGWQRSAEWILADGGSRDRTCELAAAAGWRIVAVPGTRGAQWNAAATMAEGDVLWFLHADTLPPRDAPAAIRAALGAPSAIGGGFALRFASGSACLRAIAWGSDLRARRLHIFFGDQAPFVHRSAFEAARGFPDEPLMEDLILSRRLRRLGRLVWVPSAVVTSARRFQRGGVLPTLARMQWLKVLHRLGVPPRRLVRFYR